MNPAKAPLLNWLMALAGVHQWTANQGGGLPETLITCAYKISVNQGSRNAAEIAELMAIHCQGMGLRRRESAK